MREEILNAFNFRYACKEFDSEKKINTEDFELILETGRLSPSSFGWEPWKFIVVQDETLRSKLMEFTWGAQGSLPTASHFVLIASRKPIDLKYDSNYLRYIANDVQHLPVDIQEMKLDFYKSFHTNDFDVNTDRTLYDWSSKQTYIPLANMLTTAAQLKIDSCPIEGFNKSKVDNLLEKEGVLDTNHFGISIMAAFGYRADGQEIFPKTRQSKENIVTYI